MDTRDNFEKHLKTIYNCHTHCFTIDHVPNYFIGRLLSISWLRKSGILKWLIKNLPEIIWWESELLKRVCNLLIYADVQSQKEVIDNLLMYYPSNSKFVLLTMDMEFMEAGKSKEDYRIQLDKLVSIRNEPKLKDKLFPFIFVDPRRVSARDEDEEKAGGGFSGDIFVDYLKEHIKNINFQGLKLYPAIGYYPFDKRLKDIYLFAQENNIPIISHCIRGSVHFHGKNTWATHPITRQPQPGNTPYQYANNLGHPLNYECLLNPAFSEDVWGDKSIDLSKLKICIAHFGGEDEWNDFLENPWLPDIGLIDDSSEIDIYKRPWFKQQYFDSLYKTEEDKVKHTPYSWFSVVCKLITNRKYENVYADISYTLSDPKMYPLLKVVLESNDIIRRRLLFGTDFYVVAKAGAERELCINLRGYLGEELFKQIAETNPKEFLRNKFNPNV